MLTSLVRVQKSGWNGTNRDTGGRGGS